MFVFRSCASRCYWSPGWFCLTRWLKRRSLPAGVGGGGTKRKYLQEILQDVIAGNRGDLFLTPFHLNSPWNCTANQSHVKNHCRWQNLAFNIALRVCWNSGVVHKIRLSSNVNLILDNWFLFDLRLSSKTFENQQTILKKRNSSFVYPQIRIALSLRICQCIAVSFSWHMWMQVCFCFYKR